MRMPPATHTRSAGAVTVRLRLLRCRLRAAALMLLAIAALGPASPLHAQRYQPVRVGDVPDQPYTEYRTLDSLGRSVRFYLSEAASTSRLPLVLYVHGSGHGSHFRRPGARVEPANGHATLADVVGARARVLIVEKPGVTLFDDGRSRASEEFRREFALDRWAEAVAAAFLAAQSIEGIDRSRALGVGHSEGGIVVARVARRLPAITNVAILAGGGPSQRFDLRLLTAEGRFFSEQGSTTEARLAWLESQLARVAMQPDDWTKEFFGHSYLRWSSFLESSTLAELTAAKADVFVAQGEQDAVVAAASFDSLVVGLRSAGRSVRSRLVLGADHSFRTSGTGGSGDGWAEILGEVVGWFLPN